MRIAIAAVLLLALGACTGKDGRAGTNSLVSVIAEPEGANCPAGGRAIRTGLDANANGLLESDEITAVEYLCHGTPGATGEPGTPGATGAATVFSDEAIVQGDSRCPYGGTALHYGLDQDSDGVLDPEERTGSVPVCNGPPGAATLFRNEQLPVGDSHCPAGGVALSHGLDEDLDGVLEASEVAATDYLCHGVDGAPGLNGLVAVSEEPAGSNCLAGGSAIRSGLDQNADGLLQPAEVTATSFVCNGATATNGFDSLVRQEDEAAGDHCAYGGRVILSGLDLDRSGTLDSGEVTATGYACNGAPGTDGLNSLSLMEEELPGTNCPTGGRKLSTGQDMDRDGVLDASEVQNSAFLCDAENRVYLTSEAQRGGVCPRGGIKVETGLDADGDGALDPQEIEAGRTQYVCNLYYVQVATGQLHTCALVNDGTARCWGANDYSQLGNGGTQASPSPVYVANLEGIASLSLGGKQSCALLTNGHVKCWGAWLNENSGVNQASDFTAGSVIGLTVGGNHVCVLLADRTARCWGRNSLGELGNGTTTTTSTPYSVVGLTSIAQISAGGSQSCAVLLDGTAHCWGYKYTGSYTTGPENQVTTPQAVAGITDAVAVSAGGSNSCVLRSAGVAVCSGRSDVTGILGLSGVGGLRSISVKGWSSCALKTDETAICVGTNTNGQLGDGTTTSAATPVSVSGIAGLSSLEMSGSHACAISSNGKTYCWGANNYGQLGDGTMVERRVPTAVATLHGP